MGVCFSEMSVTVARDLAAALHISRVSVLGGCPYCLEGQNSCGPVLMAITNNTWPVMAECTCTCT